MGTQQKILNSIVPVIEMFLHEKEKGKISKLTVDINQI